MTVVDGPAPAGTVLVVDDQDLVAIALTRALRDEGLDAHRVPVTGSVPDDAAGYRPGVVLLDLELGATSDGTVRDGSELITPLRAQGWRVVVVTGTTDLDRIAAAVAGGASTYVVKGADLTELVGVTVATAHGRDTLTAVRRAELVARYRETHATNQRAVAGMQRLSRREREVLDLLADGAAPAEIAASCHLSVATVRNQIHSILGKLEVKSQLAAVAIAHRHGRRPAVDARR